MRIPQTRGGSASYDPQFKVAPASTKLRGTHRNSWGPQEFLIAQIILGGRQTRVKFVSPGDVVALSTPQVHGLEFLGSVLPRAPSRDVCLRIQAVFAVVLQG